MQVQSVWSSRTYLMHRAWRGSRNFIEFTLASCALAFVLAMWAEDGLGIAAPAFFLLLGAIQFWKRYPTLTRGHRGQSLSTHSIPQRKSAFL